MKLQPKCYDPKGDLLSTQQSFWRHRVSCFMAKWWELILGSSWGGAATPPIAMHPITAVLLNPSGGIVGPGNQNIEESSLERLKSVEKFGVYIGRDALAYHGIFHDAGGFCLNFHGKGPGYKYRDADYDAEENRSRGGKKTWIQFKKFCGKAVAPIRSANPYRGQLTNRPFWNKVLNQ